MVEEEKVLVEVDVDDDVDDDAAVEVSGARFIVDTVSRKIFSSSKSCFKKLHGFEILLFDKQG